MNTQTEYYVIERNYVGPNRTNIYNDYDDVIEIRNKPAENAGTGYNDRVEYNANPRDEDGDLIAFATLDDAQNFICDKYGDTREVDAGDMDIYEYDVLGRYKIGKYEILHSDTWGDTVVITCESITAHSTDEEIEKLFND